MIQSRDWHCHDWNFRLLGTAMSGSFGYYINQATMPSPGLIQQKLNMQQLKFSPQQKPPKVSVIKQVRLDCLAVVKRKL